MRVRRSDVRDKKKKSLDGIFPVVARSLEDL